MDPVPCKFCVDIHIVYSCTHQPCHIQKMTFISLLPLLSSYILSAPLSSKLHKPRRDDLDIAFKAENITIILFSQHWLYIHVCIKCCQSQTEAFLTKDESSTQHFIYIQRTLFKAVSQHMRAANILYLVFFFKYFNTVRSQNCKAVRKEKVYGWCRLKHLS